MVSYELSRDAVIAQAGERVVGTSSLGADGEMTIVVDPDRRGQGIGRELFLATAGIARAQGHADVVLAAPADDAGTMPMLASLGLRGLARLDGDVLRVRVSLREVRPVTPDHGVPA